VRNELPWKDKVEFVDGRGEKWELAVRAVQGNSSRKKSHEDGKENQERLDPICQRKRGGQFSIEEQEGKGV